MVSTHDELRNLVARVLFPDAWSTVPFDVFYGCMPKEMSRERADAIWWERGESDRKRSLFMADRVLGAIKSAELAVVPVEATRGMAHAAHLAETPDCNYLPIVNAANAVGNVLVGREGG